MQHVTKFPLLLANIRKYTDCEEAAGMLADAIDKMGSSLRKYWYKEYYIVYVIICITHGNIITEA